MPYNRDEVVSQMTSFYQFLVKMYLPLGALVMPPEDGWTHLNEESLDFLNKDDRVINLIKHLPFIRQDKEEEGEFEPYQIIPEAVCVDYSGTLLKTHIEARSDVLMETHDPKTTSKNYAVLARPEVSDAGTFVWIDTETGKVYEHNIWESPKEFDSVTQACKTWRDAFEKLDFVPYKPSAVADKAEDDEEQNMITSIYQKHGWPTKDYNKDSCLTELLELDLE